MQTRPFYKRFLNFFKRDQHAPPEQEKQRNVSEFPLTPPSKPVKVRKQGRGKKRHPIIPQEPSNDPRFNHTLRRMQRKT